MNGHDAVAAEREPEPLLGVERDALLEPFQSPNWGRWRLVEAAELWQLVALVFGVEPIWTSRLVEFEARAGRPCWQRDRVVHLPRLARLLDDPGFKLQLDVAAAWVHTKQIERLDGATRNDTAHAIVSLSSFVAVAGSKGWPMPRELQPQFHEGDRASQVPKQATSQVEPGEADARLCAAQFEPSVEHASAAQSNVTPERRHPAEFTSDSDAKQRARKAQRKRVVDQAVEAGLLSIRNHFKASDLSELPTNIKGTNAVAPEPF